MLLNWTFNNGYGGNFHVLRRLSEFLKMSNNNKNTYFFLIKGTIWGHDSWPGLGRQKCGHGAGVGGRGRSGPWGQRDLEAISRGTQSLTKGLPCVDVNDEAGGLVSAQDLVVHWAKEDRAEGAGAAGSQGGHPLLFLTPAHGLLQPL